jgi:hypothetical protein
MKPTPEIEAQGLRAYEQARAFERIRTWRLPVVYTAIPLFVALYGVATWKTGHPNIAELSWLLAVLLAGAVCLKWNNLRSQYARNVKLLAEMERTYGDKLPWIQVERHMAAVDELQRDIAAKKAEGD